MLYTLTGLITGIALTVVVGKLLNVDGAHGNNGQYLGEFPYIFLVLAGALVGGGVGFGYGLHAFQSGTYFNFLM